MAEAPWWLPENLARHRSHLTVRSHVLTEMRRVFAARGFIEVDTDRKSVV